jgi:hypothetical protein
VNRTLVGFYVGAFCGVLTLAVLAAWSGYTHDWGALPITPLKGAIDGVIYFVCLLWWLAGAVGGVIGGLIGWVIDGADLAFEETRVCRPQSPRH